MRKLLLIPILGLALGVTACSGYPTGDAYGGAAGNQMYEACLPGGQDLPAELQKLCRGVTR
jgi:hypothetical protein